MSNRIIWAHSKSRNGLVLLLAATATAAALSLSVDGYYIAGFALAWWALIITFMNQRPRLYARFTDAQFWARLVMVIIFLTPGLVWAATRPVINTLVPTRGLMLVSVIAGLSGGSALALVHLNDTRLLLSSSIISIQPRMAPIGAFFRPLYVILLVPMEEYYYRVTFITSLQSLIPVASAVVVSSLLFVTADWSGSWGPSSPRNRLIEGAVLGLMNGGIFVLTGSIIGPILAHYIYDLPQIILPIRNFIVHRRPATDMLELSL
jgi:membrane protease YdiL (CAAX protease family)